MVGRVRENQLYVTTAIPMHESYANNLLLDNTDDLENFDSNSRDNKPNMNKTNEISSNFIGQGLFIVDDVFSSTSINELKNTSLQSQLFSNTQMIPEPPIKLEFPNPFSDDVDPTSYTEMDSKIRKSSVLKPPPTTNTNTSNSGNTNTNNSGNTNNSENAKYGEGRIQYKRVLVHSIIPLDRRVGSSGVGSFEVVLSASAKECGLWTVGAVLLTGMRKILHYFSTFLTY